MTKSQILKTAHEHAREFRRLYPSYRAALADFLKTIHADVRNARPARSTGFQIKEPSYKRNQFQPRTGMWVTL